MKAFEKTKTMLITLSIFMVINVFGLVISQDTLATDLLNLAIGFFLIQVLLVERKLKKEQTQKEV
jgi:hypothetical protein